MSTPAEQLHKAATGRSGMDYDETVNKLNAWEQKPGRSVQTMWLQGNDGHMRIGYALQKDGEDKKYIVPGQKEGEGFRQIGRDRFEMYKGGFDIDQPMPQLPLISWAGQNLGPYPRIREGYNEYESGRRDWTPPAAKPLEAAAVKPAAPATPPAKLPETKPAAATPVAPAEPEEALPRYMKTNDWVTKTLNDQNMLIKLGRKEEDFRVSFDKNGRAVEGAVPDGSGSSTILTGKALETKLKEDYNLSADNFRNESQRFLADAGLNTGPAASQNRQIAAAMTGPAPSPS